MKRGLLVLTLIAAISPPVLSANPPACSYYWDRKNTYYDIGGYMYCGSWSPFGCTECVNTGTGDSCTATGDEACDPGPFNQG